MAGLLRNIPLAVLVTLIVGCAAPSAPRPQSPAASTEIPAAIPAQTGSATIRITAMPAPTSAPAAARRPDPTKAPEPTRAPAATKTPEPSRAPAPAGSTTNKDAGAAATESANLQSKANPPPPTASEVSPPISSPGSTPASFDAIVVEKRIVELEWPQFMTLGDSQSVRLILAPNTDGYVATAELQDGKLITKLVNVPRPSNYDIRAVARLESVAFDIQPTDAREYELPINQPMEWRWTVRPHGTGVHQLSLNVHLRHIARAPASDVREYLLFSRGLDVQVTSILGMTASQSGIFGGIGLVSGTLVTLIGYALNKRRERNLGFAPTHRQNGGAAAISKIGKPNLELLLEQRQGVQISEMDGVLLRTLFGNYQRVVIEQEFRSGYSGARTYLVLPIRADGRTDAHTIAKVGSKSDIDREYANFVQFVKDTLPPITARIQEPPVATSSALAGVAALRYTFIGQPGRAPVSLRQALLAQPDPALLAQLFGTFGPNWWMQRKPYTFQAAVEYDRAQPPHWAMEPAHVGTIKSPWTGKSALADLETEGRLGVGDVVQMPAFASVERRSSGKGWSLESAAVHGRAATRVRWLGDTFSPGEFGRITASRIDLLQRVLISMDLYGFPDILPKLNRLLSQTVSGMQSTIHGDLNLENILVGPGGIIWLIDFERTREGHAVFDFAHLEAELIAHVLSEHMTVPQFAQLIASPAGQPSPDAMLLRAIHDMAGHCLFDSGSTREYDLALALTCLGATKHANLSNAARHMLYLAASCAAKDL